MNQQQQQHRAVVGTRSQWPGGEEGVNVDTIDKEGLDNTPLTPRGSNTSGSLSNG